MTLGEAINARCTAGARVVEAREALAAAKKLADIERLTVALERALADQRAARAVEVEMYERTGTRGGPR